MVFAVMQGQQCRNIGIVNGTEVEKVLWQTSEGLTLIVGARVYVRVRARVRVRMYVRVRKRARMLACACFCYPRAFLFSCMCASCTRTYRAHVRCKYTPRNPFLTVRRPLLQASVTA